jgi:hypothetical protein
MRETVMLNGDVIRVPLLEDAIRILDPFQGKIPSFMMAMPVPKVSAMLGESNEEL